ncbi:MAG: FtsX-like permease family protein, partial [archaeon]
IENIAGVTEVIPFSFKMTKLEFNRETQYKTVYIVKEAQADTTIKIMNMKLRSGTGLTGKQGRKIIIGALVADDMFKRKIKVGDTIKVDDLDFKVVGIMEYIGNSQDDSSIYMTREFAEGVYGIGDQVDEIFIKTNPLEDVTLIKDKIQKKLEKTHEKNSFIVITAVQILEIIKSILNVLKIILTAIAGISIVVGAIGIMNSIYTSVLERTKEIGVLIAIGAQPKDINYIFISESIILSFIGGVLGILLGIGIAKAVEWYALSQGFTMLTIIITGKVILLGLGLALLTGILSGVLPARRAEHMNTVDALRNKM